MRCWVNLVVLVIGVVMTARAASGVAKPSDKPNIVVILADDMGYSDIGCYGGEIRTPNLDRLASGGLRFTQFYNTGRCCPTRAALLTGLYSHQTGVGHMTGDQGLEGYRADLNERCVTIAQVLHDAGYATYMAGKWHVTKHVGDWTGDAKLKSKHNWPMQRGFDKFYGTIHGAGSYYAPTSLVDGNEPVKPADVGEGFYYTDQINGHAERWVREHKGDKPFFIYVANVAPHWPLHAVESDIAANAGRYRAGWDVLRTERYRRMVEMGLVDPAWPVPELHPSGPRWAEASDKAWHERRMEVYAAQVEAMDRGIGRIVAALQETGRLENTLILFMSDNGGCAEELGAGARGLSFPVKTRDGRPTLVGNNPAVMPGPEPAHQSYGRGWAGASNTPFRGYKQGVHEGGIASPLIVHWPARVKGEQSEVRGQRGWTEEVGHVIDVMPTCLEAAGAEYPSGPTPLEGRSLVPAFTGGAVKRGPIFWEHQGNRAVREGDIKLVASGPKGKWELYDLKMDRAETHDLAGERPEVVERLKGQWRAWAQRCHVLPWPWDKK